MPLRFAGLDARSRRIVEQRWLQVNDDGSGGMTLHELAAEYGVSAERIRQIEVAAMKKMKQALVDTPEQLAATADNPDAQAHTGRALLFQEIPMFATTPPAATCWHWLWRRSAAPPGRRQGRCAGNALLASKPCASSWAFRRAPRPT